MKKLVWVLVGVLTIIFTPVIQVRAEQNQRGLLICEIQTGSTNSASEEFIELYNQSSLTLNLASYRVEYFSAGTTNFSTPSRNIALSGTLYPGGRYLLASTGYLSSQASSSYAATLAKTGGHIRLVEDQSNQTIVHDLVGWGTATKPNGLASPAPNGGESLARKILSDGTYVDTGNNFDDFEVSISPTPESTNEPITPPDVTLPELPSDPKPIPVEDPLPTGGDEDISQPPSYLAVQITELLPNPGSPKTDSDDEFIEVYNPNNIEVQLEGYRLETGNDFSYHYTFATQTIAPQAYVAFYSKDTNLVLANSGGKARILNPGGEVISETDLYDQADDDKAWIYNGNTWIWSLTPTPGAPNITTLSAMATPVSKSPKRSPTKPKTAKVSTTKVASAKTTKPKSTPKSKRSDVGGSVATNENKKLHTSPLLLAGVATLALGYAAYEYRSDIANHIQKFRRNRKDRPTTGSSS